MAKTVKFTISMPAAEFKAVEFLRRKMGRTRSQFIRDAVCARKPESTPSHIIREGRKDYEVQTAADFAAVTDLAERRRRAIAAAGKFRSGMADLSANHDRHLEEAWLDVRPTRAAAQQATQAPGKRRTERQSP